MVEFVDIIVGLAWGDEGKGKISSALAKDYDMVCRWNGGPNAGHTVYLDGKKFKTHLIPSGVFHDKPSIIGPNCVLHVQKFLREIAYLEENGFDPSLVKIHPATHIITDAHTKYDLEHLKPVLGTTGQGIAPCYADKANRCGIQAKSLKPGPLEDFIWNGRLEGKILCEGAQSIWLDINYGDYPYVTSSETFPHNACSLGFSPKKIREIIGVAKIYDTKSGIDPLFPESLWTDSELCRLIELGQEYGSTTGRKRAVNWLNLDKLITSITLSGTTKLIVNKCDILQELGIFKVLTAPSQVKAFVSLSEMQDFLEQEISQRCDVQTVIFSGDNSNI